MQLFQLSAEKKSEYGLSEEYLAIKRSIYTLTNIVKNFLDKGNELERICRVALLMCKSGVSQQISIFNRLADYCVSKQKSDGGWLGVVDTVWCTSFISLYEEYANSVENALGWLDGQKHSDGSWGRTRRDIGRIPTTGLMLNLLPRLSSELSLGWLENQWKRETEFEPVMTYKAAFVLMAFKANNYQSPDHSFIPRVIDWLSGQQNDDFGWGPYKNHPINSTPYCTGISLLGLLQYPQNVPEDVFRKGLNWLLENQIPEGLWADHYIEEGSSWALYALTQILSYLSHYDD